MRKLPQPSIYVRRRDFLPFSPPDITEEEIEAVADTLRSGWISTGPKTREFEQEFARRVGAEAALALNSCTAGLHVALVALGIGEGAEVVTTTMTFCSSVHVIVHTGAQPVLVDIEPHTMNIDVEKVEAAITPRTKAIIPVHFAGHPVEMDAIRDIARRHHLYVVEDAAHAMPASYKGEMIGTIGDLTSFSFYATKNMTTGEGGMLTGKLEYIDRARLFSLHGMSRDAWKRYSATGSWYYEVVEAGFKYNMGDMAAAMGLVQLHRLDAMQRRRSEIVDRYNAAFEDMPELQIPTVYPYVSPSWHLYVLRLNLDMLSIDRAQFIQEMQERNVGTSVHFIPVHKHPYYANRWGWSDKDFPVAATEFQRTVSLPLNSQMSDTDIEDVIAAVQDVIETHSV